MPGTDKYYIELILSDKNNALKELKGLGAPLTIKANVKIDMGSLKQSKEEVLNLGREIERAIQKVNEIKAPLFDKSIKAGFAAFDQFSKILDKNKSSLDQFNEELATYNKLISDNTKSNGAALAGQKEYVAGLKAQVGAIQSLISATEQENKVLGERQALLVKDIELYARLDRAKLPDNGVNYYKNAAAAGNQIANESVARLSAQALQEKLQIMSQKAVEAGFRQVSISGSGPLTAKYRNVIKLPDGTNFQIKDFISAGPPGSATASPLKAELQQFLKSVTGGLSPAQIAKANQAYQALGFNTVRAGKFTAAPTSGSFSAPLNQVGQLLTAANNQLQAQAAAALQQGVGLFANVKRGPTSPINGNPANQPQTFTTGANTLTLRNLAGNTKFGTRIGKENFISFKEKQELDKLELESGSFYAGTSVTSREELEFRKADALKNIKRKDDAIKARQKLDQTNFSASQSFAKQRIAEQRALLTTNVSRNLVGLPSLTALPTSNFAIRRDAGERRFSVAFDKLQTKAAELGIPLNINLQTADAISIQRETQRLAQEERTQKQAQKQVTTSANQLQNLNARQILAGTALSTALPQGALGKAQTEFQIKSGTKASSVAAEASQLVQANPTLFPGGITNFPLAISNNAELFQAQQALSAAKNIKKQADSAQKKAERINSGFSRFGTPLATPLTAADVVANIPRVGDLENQLKNRNKYFKLSQAEERLFGASIAPPTTEQDYLRRLEAVKAVQQEKVFGRQVKQFARQYNAINPTTPFDVNSISTQDELDELKFNLGLQKKAKSAPKNINFTERQAIERANKELDKLTKTELLNSSGEVDNIATRFNVKKSQLDIAGAGKALRLGRLTNPETLIQLGFAGAFGGLPSLAGAAIGGATKAGPGGAVFGSTITQAIFAQIFDPIKEAFQKFSDEFKEAGLAFNRSILGIAAVNQANSEFTGTGGQQLPIGEQLRLQSGRAKQIQLSARSKLLPLGIAGQTEATFVQGIVSALSQRGFNATPEQIARISELTGGAIQSQRPGLLENTQLLLRDIQDVFGGGAQAKRTILSQLIRPSLGGIQSAKSTADIVKALEGGGLGGFVEAAKNLDNPIVNLNKLSGALDLLRTNAGDELLDALTPALKRFLSALDPATESGKKINALTESLGTALGTITGSFTDFNKSLLQTAAEFKDVIPQFTTSFQIFQKQIPGIITSIGGLLAAFALLNRGGIANLASKGLGFASSLVGVGSFFGNAKSDALLGFAGSKLAASKASFGQALASSTLLPGSYTANQFGGAAGRIGAGLTGAGQAAAGLGAGALAGIVGSILPIAVSLLIAGPLVKELIDAVGDTIEAEGQQKTQAQQDFFATRGEQRKQSILKQKAGSKLEGALAALGLSESAIEEEQSLLSLPQTRREEVLKQIKTVFGETSPLVNPNFIGPKEAPKEILGGKALALVKALGAADAAELAQKQSLLLPGAPDIFGQELAVEGGQNALKDLIRQKTATEEIISNNEQVIKGFKTPPEDILKAQKETFGKIEDIKGAGAKVLQSRALQDVLDKAISKASLERFVTEISKNDRIVSKTLRISRGELTTEDLARQKLITPEQFKQLGSKSASEARTEVGKKTFEFTAELEKLNEELKASQENLKNLNVKQEEFNKASKENLELIKKKILLQETINKLESDSSQIKKFQQSLLSKTFGETGLGLQSRQNLSEAALSDLRNQISVKQDRLKSFNIFGPLTASDTQAKELTQQQLADLNQKLPGALGNVISGAGKGAKERLETLSEAGFRNKFEFSRTVADQNLLIGQDKLKKLQEQLALETNPSAKKGISQLISAQKAENNNLNAAATKANDEVFSNFIEKLKASSDALANLRKGIEDEFSSRSKLLQANEKVDLQNFELVQGRRGRELDAITGSIGLGQQFRSLTGGLNGNLPSEALAALQNPDLAKDLQRQQLEEQISKAGRDFGNLPKTEAEQQEALRAEITKNSDALFNLTDATNQLRAAYDKTNADLFGFNDRGAATLSQTSLDVGATPLGNKAFDTKFDEQKERIAGKLKKIPKGTGTIDGKNIQGLGAFPQAENVVVPEIPSVTETIGGESVGGMLANAGTFIKTNFENEIDRAKGTFRDVKNAFFGNKENEEFAKKYPEAGLTGDTTSALDSSPNALSYIKQSMRPALSEPFKKLIASAKFKDSAAGTANPFDRPNPIDTGMFFGGVPGEEAFGMKKNRLSPQEERDLAGSMGEPRKPGATWHITDTYTSGGFNKNTAVHKGYENNPYVKSVPKLDWNIGGPSKSKLFKEPLFDKFTLGDEKESASSQGEDTPIQILKEIKEKLDAISTQSIQTQMTAALKSEFS